MVFLSQGHHNLFCSYIIQGYGNDILQHYPGKCQLVEGFSKFFMRFDNALIMSLAFSVKVITAWLWHSRSTIVLHS